ncbi:LysM peptidoglycan-binding domain-containing protein [bacterium]|nr:LysM peptidoglycan-binding domain-containing protein [bacterium]
MADDKATVVKDKPKEGEKPGEKESHLAPELLGKDSLAILRTADKTGSKAKADLPAVELFDSSRNGGANAAAKTEAGKPELVKHEVKKGDTLSHIVEKHLPKNEGESARDYNKRLYSEVGEVARKNGIADPDKIKPGQKIELTDHTKPAVKPADQPAVKPEGQTTVKPGDQPAVKPADQTTVKPGDQPAVTPPAELPQEPVKKPVDVDAMRKQAEVLYNATEGKWFGANEVLAKEVLKNLNEDQRKVLNEVYKDKHGKNIDEVLRSKLGGKDLTESLTYLNAKDKVSGADLGKAERVAEAIDQAANGGFLGIGTDKKTIEELLKGKSTDELKAIDAAYSARTGHSLKDELVDELSGSDLTKLTAMAEGKNDDAARINAVLEEHKEWGIGARSNANCEKDLRDTISTLNSQQIEALDKTYQERYGKSLREVLQNDDNLPKETKDALSIYLKGTDKMTAADTLAVADIAMRSQNLDMFQEAFRGASPEARAQFLQNGGEQKVNEAFGSASSNEYSTETTYSTNSDTTHAMDYVRAGKLDASTKIADNTSAFGDNEEAIEASLAQMSAAEKQSYMAGQKLASGDTANLNSADKANLEYYNKIHSALDAAGNEREVAKWEDMIATGKDGSLVTRLAAHGGMFDDGMGKVLGTIESMPKEDWERLKSDPEYRKKVEATLAIDLSDSEMARTREALDKKMQAPTYEASKEAQRSVVDAIKDETGFFDDNEDNIIRALEKMTPEEQKRYREDPEFKKQLNAEVASALDYGSERDAAMRILDKVAKGEKPESDIVAKLEMHSTNFNVDEAKVVADLEESFRKDPTLRDRLRNPQTPEDKDMAEKFNTAIHKALDQDEYDKFAKPLLETGRIPLAVKAELYQGLFNDDEKAVYDALKKDRATPEDWKEVIANPEKTLGFMSVEEREVALNIARQQGEMKPEDELRAAMLGVGKDEDKIKEVLKGFTPDQLQAAKDAYEVKYGSSLTGDTLDELGGADKVEAARELRGPQSARESYNDARSEVYESADGIGKFIVKHWDGTSEMTQDQLEQYSKAMGDYSKAYQEMPLEGRQQFEDNLYKSLELYKKSEGAAADAIVDGAIIAAGVGGAAFTGGVSLSLLAATSVGGAMFKIGAKSAILGADYDFASAQIVKDGATGAIDAATIFLGPAQAAQMLKLGERSALTAARAAMSEVDNVAVLGGKQLLKEGAEGTIKKELAEQVAVAISNGAKGVDDKAIAKIAEKVAADAVDVPQIQQILKANLAKAIETEASAGLKASMREYALNTGAGVVGGSLSGGVRGGVDGESFDAVAQQAFMGGLSGGAMAGAFTVAFKGLGRTASVFRNADGPDVHTSPVGSLEVKAVSAASEVHPPKLDRSGRIAEVITPEGKLSVAYHKAGDLEGEVRKVTFPNGNVYSSEDGVKWTVKDPAAPGGKYEVNGSMKVDAEGGVTWHAEGGSKSTLRSDGSRIIEDKHTGDLVTTDALGYVREVKKDNSGVKFDYDHDGQVQKASFDNGSVIDVKADGKVVQTKADGTAVDLDGKLKVNNDGQLTLTAADGRAQVLTPEGARLQYDGDSNRVSDFWNAKGDHYRYEYSSAGELDKVTLPDGKGLKRDPAGGWQHIDLDGRVNGATTTEYKVLSDGSFSYSQGDRSITFGLDGHERVYDTTNNKLLIERGIDGQALKSKVEVGVDGRPLEFQEKVKEKFVVQNAESKEKSLALVASELKDVRAIDANGKPSSAYDSLMSDKTLTDRQKQNILDNMSEIREHFASYRVGDRMHPDPEVNWIHTQGEMAKVLEVGRKAGLKPDELEDALLASMYSDSVKFAFPPPKGAEANFFTHHLDGALAAQESLTRKGFPPERVDRIVQAIKEHQIAPPEFMGNLYLNFKIKPGLDDLAKKGTITAERHAELTAVLKDMTVVGEDRVSRLKPIAKVNDWPKVRNADGSWEVALTPDQRELFKLAGIEHWSTPVNPVDTPGFKQLSKVEQDALVSKYQIASTLIDGDGVDNYATLGGASKIVAIRGPGTFFKDGNVWQSIDSIDASFKDTYSVLSPKGREVADASLAQRNAMLHDKQSGIKAQMNEWLKSKGLNPEEVVYLQKDGALKYPRPLDDAATLRVSEINALLKDNKIPASEIASLTSELRTLKHRGMNEEEIRQFELASEVREKMVDLLRSGHRTDNSLPGEFHQVKSEAKTHPEWLEAKPFIAPEPTGRARDFGDGTTVTTYKDGVIVKGADGSSAVVDNVHNTSVRHNALGQVTEAHGVNGKRAFTYDSEGKLNTVTFENGAVVKKENGVWMGHVKQADGTSKDEVWFRGDLVADGDGSIRSFHSIDEKGTVTIDSINGSKMELTGDRLDYLSANLAVEEANLSRLSAKAFPDVARFERFDKLLRDFDVEAAKRGITDEKKALLYLHVNRLLEANPMAVLSQAERADLAEQLMSHAVHPRTVDQGMNSTCNVTTLEVRNYAKDPEKNAQLLADIAINGKFVTKDGHTVDMTALDNGIKPDFEARRALKRQHGEGDKLKADGSRDWSSQLTENAMVNAYWQGRKHIISDGRRVDSSGLAFDKDRNLIGKIKSKSEVQMLYDKEGDRLAQFKPGDQAYTKDHKPIKNVDADSLIYSENGALYGVLPEKKIDKVFDSAGKQLRNLEPGATAYDADGKLVMRVAKPGEIKYEKSVDSLMGGEKVKYFDGENWVQLRDRNGSKMDAPSIFTNELEGVNKQATGVSDNHFVLTAGDKAKQWSGQRDVSTADELADAILELEKSGQLPAVMQVHTARPPFSQLYGIESAVGMGGGWHVINIHGYDPVTRQVKFTNQWGSRNDFLEEGYSVDKLFRSMKEPAMHKFMRSTGGKVVKGTVAAGAVVYSGVVAHDKLNNR